MAEQRHISDPLYRCPICGEQAVRVIDSRPVESATEPIVRRRRKCLSCKHRWSTFEITDAAYASICSVAATLKDLFPGITRRSINEDGIVVPKNGTLTSLKSHQG